MKIPVCIFFVFFLLTKIWAQTYSGTVIDSESREEIPFVHIGVLNKNLGVISRPNGTFSIDLSSQADNLDSLAFSIIGYETRIIPINKVDLAMSIVELQPQTISS